MLHGLLHLKLNPVTRTTPGRPRFQSQSLRLVTCSQFRASLFKCAKRDVTFSPSKAAITDTQTMSSAPGPTRQPGAQRQQAPAHSPPRAGAPARAPLRMRSRPETQPEPEVKRRDLRSGPAQYAAVRSGSGRDGASAQPVPALEHKQEWGRDEAAVGPRAARGGEPGREPERAQILSLARPGGPPELRRACSREGGPSPSRACSHEPGEPERRGRRRPAAVRQLQPG